MTSAMEGTTMSADVPGWQLTGRHVVLILIAFFGVIFSVNGYFLYSALSTYTGVVANEPYRKGLEYNKQIEAAEQQAKRGWTDSVEMLADAPVVFAIRDAASQPVTGLSIRGVLGRPSTAQHDRTLVFREVAPGRYAADTRTVESGNWQLNVEASEAGSQAVVYRARKRLWLKP